ncbi:MAG: hypothetical protein PHI66_00460 [Candidatus Pacebacteria bacterium]|nr:hypothetical protein [Candidatus Paceibacterota bacterium]
MDFLIVFFLDLIDSGLQSQGEEHGSSINKALEKALHSYKEAGRRGNIDIYVGADDRMKYEGSEDGDDSKSVVDRILRGEILKEGELLIIVRAFAFLDRQGNMIDKFETEIPYKFMGNSAGVRREDFKYPLNHVIAALGESKSLYEMGDEKAMDYYLRYSEEKIKLAIGKIRL